MWNVVCNPRVSKRKVTARSEFVPKFSITTIIKHPFFTENGNEPRFEPQRPNQAEQNRTIQFQQTLRMPPRYINTAFIKKSYWCHSSGLLAKECQQNSSYASASHQLTSTPPITGINENNQTSTNSLETRDLQTPPKLVDRTLLVGKRLIQTRLEDYWLEPGKSRISLRHWCLQDAFGRENVGSN